MEKLRKDIEEQYKWDLSVLYKNNKDWDKDYKDLVNESNNIDKYKDHLLDNSKTLLEFMNLSTDIDRKLEKIYFYAHLNYDADTSNSLYQEMEGKVENLMTLISTKTSFVEPELLKSDYAKIESFYKEESKLKEYDNIFKEIYRYKEHILSEKEETILSKLSKVLGVSADTYEKLTDTDLTFGTIKDEFNNDVELTDSNYHTYIHSSNRDVRISAFKEMYRVYKSIINTTCSTLYGTVETSVVEAKLRNYESAIVASLYGDNVTTDIYNSLIDTVNKNMEVLFKYYRLKKEKLNLDELHLYDVYVSMNSDVDKKYTFEEAKDIVLKALTPLGDKYTKDASKAFTEHWIDIYPNKGKRSGAYSSGGYDTYPYMLLNYEGNLNDVSTLIHELGHSMHSYYSKNNNKFQDYNYKIFVAEVASTTNELLLYKYLLDNTDDKNIKLNILNGLMDLFKGTMYRQTMFAEFEKKIHEMVENDEVLTPDNLCDIYYDLNKKYFGSDVVVDEEIKYEWARIPHFYYNFYVYKYATSLAASCYIATKIYNGDTKVRDNYLKFLSLGGSMYPVDELKVAGVDMLDNNVYESAINMFNECIDMYMKIEQGD